MKRISLKIPPFFWEGAFLTAVYLAGLFYRLWPRLLIDPHLLTMNADIWYRLCMAQYALDHGHLPAYCLRYIAYGHVPFWYPPLSPLFLAFLAKISSLDLATVCSRVMPFIEALTPLSLYPLVRRLYGRLSAILSTAILALTASFVYWTGISCPNSVTLFLLPLYILLLTLRADTVRITWTLPARGLWILILGELLALNFLFHLTYFLALIILAAVAVLLFLGSKQQGLKILDLTLAVAFSQIVTAFWWAPKNLYWWWIHALTTSTGFQPYLGQLKQYGWIAGITGVVFLLPFLITRLLPGVRRDRVAWLPLVWLIPPLIEAENETILLFFKRADLTWQTLCKPLEGFRFHPFLAQAFALIIGCTLGYLLTRLWGKYRYRFVLYTIVLFLIGGAFAYDTLIPYQIRVRFQNSGITTDEYRAACWFREHSGPRSRIIADYYRAQMFSGVCGGKALLGGLFPLRNTSIPYITNPAVVQDDIYTIYATHDPAEASRLMHKYRVDHIYLSPTFTQTSYFGSKLKKGFGVDADFDKFDNPAYFREVFRGISGIRIIRRIKRAIP